MECMFPGSAAVQRWFPVRVVELEPGSAASAAGVQATAWEAAHPSGAPALALRLVMNGKIVAYTGDTAWTDALTEVAAGADLLIAEAYYRNKAVPYHLRLADSENHRAELASRRIVLTHMSADMLAGAGPLSYECASDGMTLRVSGPDSCSRGPHSVRDSRGAIGITRRGEQQIGSGSGKGLPAGSIEASPCRSRRFRGRALPARARR